MDKLQIGEIIFRLRKKKKITQEELGKIIGVSTAAVSKWESGNSYPDITFLPLIADFFGVSIDKLLNYKIELSDDEVMKVFKECSEMFINENFNAAVNKSEEYLSKYKASYNLKLKIGFLFIFYSWKSSDEEVTKKMRVKTQKLFEDIVQNCDKEELVEQALYQLSNIYSLMGRDDDAIEALNKIRKSELNVDIMLASIYIKKGDLKKGRGIFQSELYKDICFSGMVCSSLAESYAESERNLSTSEKYYNLSINIKKAFMLGRHSVLDLWDEYLGLAKIYLKFNEKKKALSMLNKMMEDIGSNNVISKSDRINSTWCFNEIEMPKSDGNIRMNFYRNILRILQDPSFDLIREEDDFNHVVNKLNNLKEGSEMLG